MRKSTVILAFALMSSTANAQSAHVDLNQDMWIDETEVVCPVRDVFYDKQGRVVVAQDLYDYPNETKRIVLAASTKFRFDLETFSETCEGVN